MKLWYYLVQFTWGILQNLAGCFWFLCCLRKKQEAIVWTVNKEASMRRFLDSRVDAVITDEIEMAERVQESLDERTDLEVLQDRLGDFWDRF